METASLISGLSAVVLYLLCFQLKSAKKIIACKFFSSLLYVLQYLLLGAFVGAAMDTAAAVTSALGYKKDTPFISRYKLPILIFTNAGIVLIGILLYDSIFSLLAIAGVLLESAANWVKKEKTIRLVSLLAVPCWFTYNAVYQAYGSAIGNVLALVSILVALLRYSNPNAKKTKE